MNPSFLIDRDEIDDLREVAAIFEDVAQEVISLTTPSVKCPMPSFPTFKNSLRLSTNKDSANHDVVANYSNEDEQNYSSSEEGQVSSQSELDI